MNYVRIALAAIAAWVVSLGLDFLINNIWLVRLYEANSWAYRHAEQMTPLLPIGFGVQEPPQQFSANGLDLPVP